MSAKGSVFARSPSLAANAIKVKKPAEKWRQHAQPHRFVQEAAVRSDAPAPRVQVAHPEEHRSHHFEPSKRVQGRDRANNKPASLATPGENL